MSDTNEKFTPEQVAFIDQLAQQRIEGPESQREIISAAFKEAGVNFHFSQDEILSVVDSDFGDHDGDLAGRLKYVAVRHPTLVRPHESTTTERIPTWNELRTTPDKVNFITKHGLDKFTDLVVKRRTA